MNNAYTEDSSEIMANSHERNIMREILNAWAKTGLPDDFNNDKVKFGFNLNSGYVFLFNADYQCAMLEDEYLKSFYSTPYNGEEGFWDDLVAQYHDMHPEDQEYMRDIANGRELPLLDEVKS